VEVKGNSRPGRKIGSSRKCARGVIQLTLLTLEATASGCCSGPNSCGPSSSKMLIRFRLPTWLTTNLIDFDFQGTEEI
jgi:hypothetical protein